MPSANLTHLDLSAEANHTLLKVFFPNVAFMTCVHAQVYTHKCMDTADWVWMCGSMWVGRKVMILYIYLVHIDISLDY